MKKLMYILLISLSLAACSEEIKIPSQKFKTVQNGMFFFGSENGSENEGPSVNCRVDEFQLATTEVSNAQFEAFVKTTNHVTDAEKNGGFVFEGTWKLNKKANWRKPKGKDINYEKWKLLPVVQVSYNDALAYCDWANCRLPSEIEWEYAAKLSKPDAMKSNITRPGRTQAKIAKVESFGENELGFYNQSGNVWEWCADVYNYEIHEKLSIISTTESFDDYQGRSYDPEKINDSGMLRVIKGGSFLCQSGHCEGYRPAARQSAEQSEAYFHIGFRVVKN